MLIPQTEESTWLPYLRDLPALAPTPNNLLVIAPHPDDETLAAGGLIAALRSRDATVQVAAVTDGENAYPDTPGLGPLRRQEQTSALQRLGVGPNAILRLGLPDGGIAACEDALVDLLLPHVTEGTHILTPWTGDFHPDHEACGRAATRVARMTGAPLTFWLFWTWHRGGPETLAGLPLRSFALTPELLHAKSEALLCHRSQLVHSSGDPILPEDLLAPARRPFEIFIPS